MPNGNGNGKPPDMPEQSDRDTVVGVNRLSMQRFTILQEGVSDAESELTIAVHSKAMGKITKRGNPDSNELEELDEAGGYKYSLSAPLSTMSQEFQDALALIEVELEAYATVDAFPPESE